MPAWWQLPSEKLAARRYLYYVAQKGDAEKPMEDGFDAADTNASVSVEEAFAAMFKDDAKPNQFLPLVFDTITALYMAEAKTSTKKIYKIDCFKMAKGIKVIDRSGGRSQRLNTQDMSKEDGTTAMANAKDYGVVMVTPFINSAAVVDVFDTSKQLDDSETLPVDSSLTEFREKLADENGCPKNGKLLTDYHFVGGADFRAMLQKERQERRERREAKKAEAESEKKAKADKKKGAKSEDKEAKTDKKFSPAKRGGAKAKTDDKKTEDAVEVKTRKGKGKGKGKGKRAKA